MSLNFAVFRAALERGERIGAGPVLRAWRRLLVFLSRWFQIESLYKFNAKFRPDLGAAVLRLPEHAGTCRGSRSPPSRPRRSWSGRARAAPDRPPDRPQLGLAKRPQAPACAGGRSPGARRSRCGTGEQASHRAARSICRACRGADRCLVMGVVNVTPDSFSDGGQWYGADAAIEHGLELVAQGADIVDVGGESTRPGAQRVSADGGTAPGRARSSTELVAAGVPVSRRHHAGAGGGVRAERRRAAGQRRQRRPGRPVDAPPGRRGRACPTWSCTGAATAATCTSRAVYADVVGEVRDELARRVDAVIGAGVDPGRIVLDPGLGFGKRPEHNWPLLPACAELATLGGRTFPVLVGASRKRFLGNAAGRAGRHAAAVRGLRRGHGRGHGAGRRGGRLVRPRPPGPGQRGRGPGGRRLARRRGRPGGEDAAAGGAGPRQ